MNFRKVFSGILSTAIIILLASAIYVYFSGGGKYIIGGIKISLTTVISPLTYAALCLSLYAIVKPARSTFDGFAETIANLCVKDSESKKIFFYAVIIFLLAGIFLGVNNYGTSSIVSQHITDFKTASQSYGERLSNIEVLVLFYGTFSFLAGVLAYFIFILGEKYFFREGFKNPLLLLFSLSALVSTVVLNNAPDVFKIIKSKSEIIPSNWDIVVFTVLIFLIFYCIPLFSAKRDMSKTALSVFLSLIVFLIYPSLGYLSVKSINNELNKNHRRVILITIDTTRADHLSSYDYSYETTPFIDSVAKKGARFINAYSQIPTTDPSHTSILTGKYPRTHGLLMNAAVLPQKGIPSLQEWFKKQGYATAAVTSRVFLDPGRMGMPGFDYVNIPTPRKENTRRADFTYKRVMKWLKQNYYKDIFLWVHFWDPHDEYEPVAPYNRKFNDGYKGKYIRTKDKHGFFADKNVRYSDEEVKYITSLYDGEIAYVDTYIEKLFNFFEEKIPDGVEKPLFVITGDHGETLGEIQDTHHYAFRHAKLVRYGSIHVPLIMKWEGVIPEGQDLNQVVESVDIAPTIMSLASNGAENFKTDGKSFAGLLLGQSDWKRDTAFAQRRLYTEPMKGTEFLNAREYGVMTDKWFLVTNEMLGTELYNIAKDPLEQNDISSKNKNVVAELIKQLEEWKKEFPEIKPFTGEISKEKTKALKSLGYL